MDNAHADYPVEIDLGRKELGMNMASATGGGKNAKPLKFYPTLYIESVPGLEQLPREGCIMIKFRRKRLSLEEGADGKDTAGATLEIRKLCLPEDMEGDGETLDDAFSKLGKGEVADDGAKYGYEDADDDDEE